MAKTAQKVSLSPLDVSLLCVPSVFSICCTRAANSWRHHRDGNRLVGRRNYRDSEVTLVADATKLTRAQKTSSVGSLRFRESPIGTYSLTFTHDGFQTLKIPSVLVQADRTATVNATSESRTQWARP